MFKIPYHHQVLAPKPLWKSVILIMGINIYIYNYIYYTFPDLYFFSKEAS